MGEGCDHDHGHGHKHHHHHHHHEGEEEEEEIKKKKEMEIKSSNSKSKTYEKSYFDVLGICCSSEVGVIEKILKPLEGVHQVSVIVPSRTVIVHHDSLLISQLQIVNALNKARLEANVRVKGESSHQKKWPSPFAIACGILCLLSLLKFAYRPFEWLGLGAVAVGIYPILLKGIASVRNFRLDINILMIIAVAASIALKDYCEAGAIVFLFTIAQWLESRASHKATSLMSSLMSISPQRAVLVETGEEVDVSEVMVNTVLAVKAGDIIPLDGIVVDGKCEVDQKTLTGESFPVAKQIDSSVFAGTINLNGYISVKTTALADDCVVARMAKLVEEAQNNKSKTQRFIDKCAIYYTPAVVVLSACLAIIPVALGVHNRNQWYHLALVVLVSACPCSLILSTPTATFCALAKAATSGLLIKGAEYLETLAKVKVVAFDKTGTITRGEFLVTDFHPFMEGVSLDALLYWVSSIESKSSHPMAAALVNYAQAHAVEPKPEKVEEFQNFPGEGIYGKIDGECIYVGNRKIAVRAGCADVPTSDNLTNEGKSMGYIFLGSSCAGTFNLSDVCRTGVAEALKELKSMSIKTVMLTGDCLAAAKHAQDELGGVLDEVHAELLPEDKARFIKEYQKKSPTTMVGDGLNDAAALATADIGISMGVSGSALATETGHITLMSNDIRKIPFAVRLAKKGRMKIIENVALSFTIKAGIVGLAIAGYPLVWAAVLADVGTCLLVIFNSMLLLRGTVGYRRKHYSSSHDHKHGCKQTHSHSSHSHGHSRCASGSKASNKCMTQTCCSKTSVPSSCESNKKCSDSKTKHGCCESPLPVKTSSGNNMCSESKDVHGCCETNKCSDSKTNASCCDTGPLSSAPHGNNKHGYCESGFTISRVYGNDKCPELKSSHSCCESPFISVSHGDENCSKQENKHGCCDPGPHSAASCGKNSDLENKHHHGSNKCSNSEDKPGCCEANKKGSVSKNSSNCCKSRLSSSLSSASHGNSKHGCCESGLHISVRGGNDNCVELKNPHGCCEPLSIPTSDGDEMCPNLENKHGCCDSGSLIAVSCTENCLESENEHAHGINKCSDSENKPACCESASSIKSQDNSLCLESENVHGCCTHADQVHAHEHLVHGSSSDVITIDIEKQDVPSAQGCAVHSYPSSCSEKHFHEKSHHGMLHCHGAHEAKHSDHHGIAGMDSEPIGSCKSHHGMLHCHGAHEAKHSDHHGIASTDGEPIGSCKSHHRTLHCHGAHEAKYSDHHGITGTDSEPIGSCKSHHGVLHCHGVHKAKHSDHGTAGTGSEPMGSCNAHEHSNHACEISEVCGNVKGNKHCHHGKAYITEEELKHMVRTCCEYYSSNHHKVQSGCKNHHGSNHGSRAHGCMSLEKRHVGGCCKSFREECCGKGTPFPLGGLSEIVIE